MLDRSRGTVVLTVFLLAMSLAGAVAVWAAWPRTTNTSPLAALFAVTWTGVYLLAAILVWRRSPLAPIVFLAAVGLLLFPASFMFPGSQVLLPSLIVLLPVALFGIRFLRNARLSQI